MNVTTVLELYTTFAGWIFHNVVFDIIKLGIVAIPFLVMILNNMKEAAKSGSFKKNVDIARANIESDFYEMILVGIFFLVPFFPLQLNTIAYQPPAANFLSTDIPARITTANDPSTYSTAINPTVTQIQTDYGSPKVPIAIYFVLKAAYGANYALSKAVIESNARNDLSAAEQSLSQFAMNDPVLSSELMQFNVDCFRRARSKFINFSSDGTINSLLTAAGRQALRDNPNDINRMGSIVLQTTPGLYKQCTDVATCQRSLQASQPIQGWAYSQSRDGVRPQAEQGLPGQPRCDEWWQNLRGRVVDSAPGAATVVQKIKTNFGISLTNNEQDFLSERIIRNSYVQNQSQIPITMVGLSGGKDPGTNELQRSIADLGLKYQAFKESFKTEATKNAIYILLALALMIFYLNIPIILLFTGLRIKGVVIVVGLLVTLIMAHSVMAIVEFMEVSIYNSVYGDKTAFFLKSTRIDITVYQYIMNIAYPLVVALYFYLMGGVLSAATRFADIGGQSSQVRPSSPPQLRV